MNMHVYRPIPFLLLAIVLPSLAGIQVQVDHQPPGEATAHFRFSHVPPPSRNDAPSQARFELIDGQPDPNGGGLNKLHDGQLPLAEDQPSANFFFNAGTDGGRLLIDLGSLVPIAQINTYSWHPGSRGPQLYTLYASDGTADSFLTHPKRRVDPVAHSWLRIAEIDTRPDQGLGGGQYGVSIADPDKSMGPYRYLLFDILPTRQPTGAATRSTAKSTSSTRGHPPRLNPLFHPRQHLPSEPSSMGQTTTFASQSTPQPRPT